ncbi:hypothetical protein B0T21DRAFT_413563 [Apiosordaria backusii]|uniref:Uncharacterized protein n=1 Tax=Apiosordaria backusii TaxID=314023 RepID=A0AA40B217_9PEZI|nr:hypothetical protein B0T21DRAFT_413563 [Apiosordaria backusii]
MAPFSLLALALMPLMALAAPPTSTVEKRDTPGNVWACTGPSWQGTCDLHVLGVTGACQPIPDPWKYNIGSIGPDRGAICRLFDDAHSDCTGSGLAIVQYPGNTNLITPRDFPGYHAAYWSCQPCSNCQ